MNKCRGCERDFTSVSAFDKHRTGSFSRNERRCMTEAEMLGKGLEHKSSGKWGMISGPWLLIVKDRRLRAAAYKMAV